MTDNINENMQPISGDDNQIIIYSTADGKVNLEVQIDANTVWLTQQQICLLYGKAKSTISEHLTHIFGEGELDPQVVVRENRTTTHHGAIEGKTQDNRGQKGQVRMTRSVLQEFPNFNKKSTIYQNMYYMKI